MTVAAPLLELKTYEDLRALPEDGKRYELVQGEIVMAASPKRRHQIALMNLYNALWAYLDAHPVGDLMLSPFDVKFSEATVVQPDLFVVLNDRKAIVTEDFCDGPPDIVAEVLSPSNRGYDLVRKAAIYLEHRVSEYWVLDPDDASITVNVWHNGLYVPAPIEGGFARSTVLPGLAVAVAKLFPGASPQPVQPDEME